MKRKFAIFYGILGVVLLLSLGIVSIMINERNRVAPKTSTQLYEELQTLRQASDALYDKLVPDSLKISEATAYNTLIYAENGNEDYWQTMRNRREVKEFIENCKPLMYVQKLIEEKQKEIAENPVTE